MTTQKPQGWLPTVISDLFDYPLFAPRVPMTAPAINVKETDKDYWIEVAAPGMTKEDFDVRINEKDYLIISLQKREKKEKKETNEEPKCAEGEKECKSEVRYLRREFSFSKFQQVMSLPDNVDIDHIEAKVKNGVLKIRLPKRTDEEIQKAHKTIEIL
jgi:HSP20 family protein